MVLAVAISCSSSALGSGFTCDLFGWSSRDINHNVELLHKCVDELHKQNEGLEAEVWSLRSELDLIKYPLPAVRPLCCKRCKTGKACGDSCVAKWMACAQPKGCACDVK